MAEVSMQVASVSGDPTAKLTDDILANIISRVPYKSTCCCKCVCTHWRDLISHPYHGKKMTQSLVGFFYERCHSFKLNSSFTNISGKFDPLIDPSLSFLPRFCALTIMDCCNGLLLCYFYRQNAPEMTDYVVCNPATEKWVVVLGTDYSRAFTPDVRLAFDPAVSSHFHLCEFIDDRYWGNQDYEPNDCIAAVVIYSSKTGVWSHKADAWSGYEIETPPSSKSVFFKGVLYQCAFDHKLIALDVEENNWKVIPLPTQECHGDPYDICLSQGQLYFAHKGDSELSIWVLEDPSSENWSLKHNISHLQLFGTEYSPYADGYSVCSIHPDRSLIFLVCQYEETLMSYDMDSRELCSSCQLGWDGKMHWFKTCYLPYVPLYSELLADGR